MRKDVNPFEPGAGTKPRELVGRDMVLEDAEAAIARAKLGRPIRGQIYYGLRGVGKTVLLREVSTIAAKQGGLVADLETPEDKPLTSLIAPAIRKLLIALSTAEKAKAAVAQATNALQSFASIFKVKIGDVGLEVKSASGLAASGDLEADLGDLLVALGEAAKAHGKVIVFAIDELQYLKEEEFAALISAVHRLNQKALPVGVFGAGLPQLLGLAGDAKSYAERLFHFIEIGALPEADAKRAIRDPVIASGAQIDNHAIDYIVRRSRGYPYFLQEWGYRSWNEAPSSPISLKDCETAEPKIIESLDKSFFRVRYDRLSPGEQQYLRAMAELGSGPHQSGAVAKMLGKQASQAGPVRAQVIAKGMAFSNQYGLVQFSVPLFDEFMKRAMPEFGPKPVGGKSAAKPSKAKKSS